MGWSRFVAHLICVWNCSLFSVCHWIPSCNRKFVRYRKISCNWFKLRFFLFDTNFATSGVWLVFFSLKWIWKRNRYNWDTHTFRIKVKQNYIKLNYFNKNEIEWYITQSIPALDTYQLHLFKSKVHSLAIYGQRELQVYTYWMNYSEGVMLRQKVSLSIKWIKTQLNRHYTHA